jgi:hypothetical protein
LSNRVLTMGMRRRVLITIGTASRRG